MLTNQNADQMGDLWTNSRKSPIELTDSEKKTAISYLLQYSIITNHVIVHKLTLCK